MTHTRINFTLLVGVVALSIVALMPAWTEAAVVRAGEVYTINADTEEPGDMYLVGEFITLRGSTSGDVFIGAGSTEISGFVGGDILGAGSSVSVPASVDGDVRIAGEDVHLNGTVSEDVLLFGSRVVVGENARIGGDLFIFAEYAEVHGTVEGTTKLRVSNALLGGTYNGPVDADVSMSLAIESGTRFEQNLEYRAPRETVISDTVTVGGEVLFTPIKAEDSKKLDAAWPGFLYKMLVSVISGVLLFFLFPTFARKAAERVLSNNGTLALIGFAVLVCTPLLALLIMATILGILPAIFVLFTYAGTIVLASALSPVLAGAALMLWAKKGTEMKWRWIVYGAVVLTFLTLVPVVGWIVRTLVFLTAFGVIAVLAYDHVWKHRKHHANVDLDSSPTTTPHTEHNESPIEETTETKEAGESNK